jgi:hypothetical protein
MHIRFWLFICLSCLVRPALAQQLALQFQPTWAGKPIVAGAYYKLPSGDSLQLSNFRCYISGIVLAANGKAVYTEANSYHLLDMAEPQTMRIVLPHIPKYQELRFAIGVDSTKSVSGALGGDLDPEHGMYWAWQSGYINFKIEGSSPLCNTRRNEFQFHIGGYAGKDNALVQISLQNADAPNEITIEIPLDAWMQQIDLRKQHTIMTPSVEAVQLAKQLASVIKIAH